MSEEHISAREFDNAIKALTNAMADGFSGVNARVEEGLSGVHRRLDVTNGRLGKHDTEIMLLLKQGTTHSSALKQIETQQTKEYERQEHQRHTDAEHVKHLHSRSSDDQRPAGDNEPITVKDVKHIAWVLGGVMTLMGVVVKYGPVVLKAIAP